MNPFRKLNDWLARRGITWNELNYIIISVSTLIAIIGFSIWVLTQ
jgi:hypothetical protein